MCALLQSLLASRLSVTLNIPLNPHRSRMAPWRRGLLYLLLFLTPTASGVAAMTERAVRCPYCIVHNEFRPMIPLTDGNFVCTKCGHLETPDSENLKCHCPRCIELRALGFRQCG